MKNREAGFARRRELDAAYPPLTNLKELVYRAAEFIGDKKTIHEKVNGEMVSYSRVDLLNDMNALGTAIVLDGFKGENTALIGENTYRWMVIYFANVNGGNLFAPLDKEIRGATLAKLINKSNSKMVFFDKEHEAAVAEVKADCPSVKSWVMLTKGAERTDTADRYLDDMLAEGKKALAEGNREYLDIEIDPEAPAAIHFTSGTTGANKGVVLCHRNAVSNVLEERRICPTEERQLSVLPFNHTYEWNCAMLSRVYGDIDFMINDSLRNIVANMKMFQPGEMTVVPLFLDLIAGGIKRYIRATKSEARFGRLALLSNQLLAEGIDAREKIFAEFRRPVDENLSLLICGGAPLNPEVVKFLATVGVDCCNGFGITECSPLVSLNDNANEDPLSVGKPLPTLDVKIDDPDADGTGEILVKGPSVMLGYYEDEEATKQVFTEDGYFRTGDFGYISSTGNIYICGRKKNIIILDNGKNVHPEEIETEAQQKNGYITEMVAYQRNGENEKGGNMIAAILHIDRDNYFPGKSDEEIIAKAVEDIKAVNAELPSYKRISAIQITYGPLPQTTTRKVKRPDTIARFKDEPMHFIH